MNAPCYNCPERHKLCHSDCKKYAEFKALNEAERQAQKVIKTGNVVWDKRVQKYMKEHKKAGNFDFR